MASQECYKGDLNLEATELRLGLPEQSSSTASSTTSDFKKGNKRSSSDLLTNEHSAPDVQDDDSTPPIKARVVGWPPVRSYRKNNLKVAKFEGSFVKVNIDGAPYMRKIDLKAYKSYADMVTAIENMYKVAINQSDFVPIYQDEDGDWMMAGDVPWEMFVKSCKRIRIMKSAAAKEKGYC